MNAWSWFALALMALGCGLVWFAVTARPWVYFDPKAKYLPSTIALLGLAFFSCGVLIFAASVARPHG
jgi:hypothetical protein